MKLSHVGADGRARMVNVGGKAVTDRTATAEGAIRMSQEAFELVKRNVGPKGDVLPTAQLAGVMGAKRTAELIPLCHTVQLDQVSVEATLDDSLPGVRVRATVAARDRTGVEMEALTAVGVALLTVYDMAKAVDRSMDIQHIRLVEKAGGRSGAWRREEAR